jgi:DNA-binding NtrC family response regulator
MKEDRPFRIFVVEDDDWYNKLLVHNLSLNPDYEVQSFRTGKDCLNKLNDAPDAVTLDYRLPDMDGADVLKKIKEENPDIQVIIISGQEDIDVVVELLKAGAYDYIVKTNDIRQRLLNTVHNIRQRTDLKSRIVSLQKEVEVKYDFQKSIIGDSPAIKKIFGLIEKAIQTNITVTITGETGTGKELVAKAIHYNSSRKSKPFVAVNAAAIPSELIESELFGHEKGAFTGAATQRLGKFEEADGGTLFLDEVGEMDISFQAKLLRALQEKEITRVGSNKVIKTDCRIIVATNRNLAEEVKAGKFREDLYYRFFGLPIELPPLRERGNDILVLSKFFLDKFCKENKLDPKSLSEDAQQKLMAYSFPGNIRELKSVIDLAAVMADGKEIGASDITLGTPGVLPDVMNGQLTLREYNFKIVSAYLRKHENNIPLVAEKLDISQSTIYRMLKEGKMDVER